jgi:hypothetical protein
LDEAGKVYPIGKGQPLLFCLSPPPLWFLFLI